MSLTKEAGPAVPLFKTATRKTSPSPWLASQTSRIRWPVRPPRPSASSRSQVTSVLGPFLPNAHLLTGASEILEPGVSPAVAEPRCPVGLELCRGEAGSVEAAGFCYSARLTTDTFVFTTARAFCQRLEGSLASPYQPGLLAYLKQELAIVMHHLSLQSNLNLSSSRSWHREEKATGSTSCNALARRPTTPAGTGRCRTGHRLIVSGYSPSPSPSHQLTICSDGLPGRDVPVEVRRAKRLQLRFSNGLQQRKLRIHHS